VARTLENISDDIVHLEQYMDFVRHRHFRQTVLCRAGRKVRRALSPGVMEGLFVASAARPEVSESGEPVKLTAGVTATFTTPAKLQASTADPVTKAALLLLGQAWPLGMALDEVVAAARQQVAATGPAGAAAIADADPRTVMIDLFQCFLSGVVELRSWQPPCANSVSERPVASAFAIEQCREDSTVTTLRHERVSLSPFSVAMLPLLDGSRTRDALALQLGQAVAAGKVPLPQHGALPVDASALAERVAYWVDKSLESLARHALLEGQVLV
jgi:methyltransferase-like protein